MLNASSIFFIGFENELGEFLEIYHMQHFFHIRFWALGTLGELEDFQIK